jgi:hypothetical protein
MARRQRARIRPLAVVNDRAAAGKTTDHRQSAETRVAQGRVL